MPLHFNEPYSQKLWEALLCISQTRDSKRQEQGGWPMGLYIPHLANALGESHPCVDLPLHMSCKNTTPVRMPSIFASDER